MKKQEQKEINEIVEMAIDDYNVLNENFIHASKLRSCSATVYETDTFYVLRSYHTIVALVNKYTGDCFDFLRKVYGYTSTSAQHISKFRHDYATGKMYTWRYVG